MVRLAEALLVGRAVVLMLTVEPIERLCEDEGERVCVKSAQVRLAFVRLSKRIVGG